MAEGPPRRRPVRRRATGADDGPPDRRGAGREDDPPPRANDAAGEGGIPRRRPAGDGTSARRRTSRGGGEPAARPRRRRAERPEPDRPPPEPVDDVPDDDVPEDEAPQDEPEPGGEERAPAPKRMGARAVARAAVEQVVEMTGKSPEGVTAVSRSEDGWLVGVEVVETQRIPDSADVLAIYETELDAEGELMSYRRVRRYTRGRGDDE